MSRSFANGQASSSTSCCSPDNRFRDIVRVEWHVSRQGHDRLVSCMVHSRSGDYRAQVGSEVTEEAIGRALDKIVRQRRRRKAIRETARRHLSHDGA